MKKIIFLLVAAFLSFNSFAGTAPSCQSAFAPVCLGGQDTTTDGPGWSASCSSLPGGYGLVQGDFECGMGGSPFRCGKLSTCSCPDGQKLNTSTDSTGVSSTSCVPDDSENPPAENPPDDACPSGQPKVNGSCTFCFQYNPDGTCKTDDQSCGEGQVSQGTLNGRPICQNTCPDPNQSYGVFNGVAGCYGAPSCPNGASFGSVNGVYGCYGGGDSNSNGSSGSGTSSGSNGSSGSGNGGSNGSSGSGNNGNNNGTENGGSSGSGGGGGGNNNSSGVQYSPNQACPTGYVKDGNYCVNSQGDCPSGYHSVVVSASPFYAMCVQNNTASSSSASSTPSSTPSSSANSSAPSSAPSSSPSSSGSGSSTGGGGGSDGGDESGECDPTSKEYSKCITGDLKDLPDHVATDSGKKNINDINADFRNRLTHAPVVESFSRMKNIVVVAAKACPTFSVDIFGRTISTTIHCDIWTLVGSVLSVIMMAFWTIVAFKVFASA